MRILAINVEIGFGHPNYLDYVIQALKLIQPKIELEYWDVLNQEKGLTRLFWQASKKIYSFGAKGGMITDLYNKIRQRANAPDFPICTIPKQKYDRILVSHPLLARYLGSVWHIHGEIATPKECMMSNVDKIVIPANETKEKFIKFGIKPDNILVTGLLIAPDLVANAKENYLNRVSRIKSDKPLTIGFFVSGAYPEPHIRKIVTAITSISRENHRAIVFIGTDMKKAKEFLRRLHQSQSKNAKMKQSTPHLFIQCVLDRLKPVRYSTQNLKIGAGSILFIQGKDRRDYEKRINRLLPLLDCFVAASHEHTNWALGLGLPMFVLFPMIGSYAVENFKFAYEHGVVYPIHSIPDAQNLGKIILQLRESGELIKMGERGFDKFPIDGAKKIALEILGKE
jgi:hypothetical protein